MPESPIRTPPAPPPSAVPASTRPSPRQIRPLPSLLVNQIAAGEVVERPASVVKELVENALDAGARRITVDLEGGGIELVRVTDDGSGIGADGLLLALAAHATSKIAAPEDLDRIVTMGFRGEAIASIASVSRLSIRSRTGAETGASIVEAEGDRVGPVRPAPGPVGTSVTVRNLFFNTPARRKFLRTVPTEQGRCVDAVESLAMANPAVGFTVTADARTFLDLPPGQTPRERVLGLLGAELAPQLLEVHADQFDDARGLLLWGMVGLPAIARGTNKSQHVFLNGRPIRDKTVQHAVSEAYRGLIEPGRYPTAVIMLEMDPGAVDVNVHPAKLEVRFRDQSLVHSVVLRAVREALRGADLTPRVGGGGVTGAGGAGSARFGEDRAILPGVGIEPATAAERGAGVRAFVDYFKQAAPSSSSAGARLSYDALRDAMTQDAGAAPIADPGATQAEVAPGAPPDPAVPTAPPAAAPSSLQPPRPASRVLQVHNSYLVTQDEQGVVIIDQHALHERVMFEYLTLRLGEGALESQRLLTPAVVPAAAAQIERLAELRPMLSRLGIEAEPIGPASVAVQAFPTFLFDRGVEPGPFMADLLDRLDDARAESVGRGGNGGGGGGSADGGEGGALPGGEELLHEVLDMMACKAAVKAGDHMSDPELQALITLRESVERSSSCPHGRPTSVRLTIRELEKLFHRT